MRRLRKFVKPTGKVVFTVMSEQEIPHTLKSRLATAAVPFLFGFVKDYVYMRLDRFQTPMPLVYELTRKYFSSVETSRWQSPRGNIETHVVASGGEPRVEN